MSESNLGEGTLLFPSPQLIADPSIADGWGDELSIFNAFGRLTEEPAALVEPGQPGGDVLFLLGINPSDEERYMALRLGDMSTEAIANHFPTHAQRAAKPKVIFRGGRTSPMILVLAHVVSDGDVGDIAILTPDQLDGKGIINTRFFQGIEMLDRDYVHSLLEAGLLESESASINDVFTTQPAETWRNIMARRPYPQNLYSTWAANPHRN